MQGEVREPFLAQQRTANASGDGRKDELAFSLLGEATVDLTAKRKWSDAYLMLTQVTAANTEEPFHGDCEGRVVNWISAQSVPELLPPYSAGSARSGLLTLLEQGHQGVKLSREELDKIACWIDLLVPYCGDYREANAWTAEEMKKYERYAEKRRQMEETEQQNVDALLGRKDPARGSRPGGPMMRGGY